MEKKDWKKISGGQGEPGRGIQHQGLGRGRGRQGRGWVACGNGSGDAVRKWSPTLNKHLFDSKRLIKKVVNISDGDTLSSVQLVENEAANLVGGNKVINYKLAFLYANLSKTEKIWGSMESKEDYFTSIKQRFLGQSSI